MTRLTLFALILALPLVALAQASRPSSPEAWLTRELPPVAFAGMGLEKALAKLSQVSGLDIRADWPSLAQAGIDKNTPVQFRSEKASLDRLLDQLLVSVSPKPLAWARQGELVIVSTQQGIMSRNQFGREPPSAAPAKGEAKPGETPPAKSFRQSESLGYKPTKLELTDTPLPAALDFVHDLAGVNIHVNWRSLELAGVTAESTVTLKVQDLPPGKVLDLILDSFNSNKDKFAKLYWVIDEGVVEIATGEALNATTKVQTFDISDLLMTVPSFSAPSMNLSSSGSGTTGGTGGTSGGMGTSSAGGSNSFSPGSSGGGSSYGGSGSGSGSSGNSGSGANVVGGATRQDVQNSLLQIIRDSIGQDMWQPTGKGSLQVLNGRLVISQTPLGFKLMEQAFR